MTPLLTVPAFSLTTLVDKMKNTLNLEVMWWQRVFVGVIPTRVRVVHLPVLQASPSNRRPSTPPVCLSLLFASCPLWARWRVWPGKGGSSRGASTTNTMASRPLCSWLLPKSTQAPFKIHPHLPVHSEQSTNQHSQLTIHTLHTNYHFPIRLPKFLVRKHFSTWMRLVRLRNTSRTVRVHLAP
jgi:hypothetical protein